VALNLLAQYSEAAGVRSGSNRTRRARATARWVLGAAAEYASFTVPGTPGHPAVTGVCVPSTLTICGAGRGDSLAGAALSGLGRARAARPRWAGGEQRESPRCSDSSVFPRSCCRVLPLSHLSQRHRWVRDLLRPRKEWRS